jgi:snRNA-activating protein complex subunit 3
MGHFVEENKEAEPIDSNEVILSVALYDTNPKSKGSKSQEYLVLGSQYLSTLKDRIYCLNDHILNGQNIKSGYFFIENTFYNDTRQPNNMDYSLPILEWVNINQRYTQPNLGVFTSKSMENVRFKDLSIRIGAPYVFVHQGNCEHLIMFTSLR